MALKILPEAFASDPDRLARFQRQAQVLASLDHPGIAAIYGIEEAERAVNTLKPASYLLLAPSRWKEGRQCDGRL